MNDGAGIPRRGSAAGLVVAACVLAAYYLYLRYHVDPRLVLHTQTVVFRDDLPWFRGFLEQLGGPAAYTSAFLSQALMYRDLGSAVLAGCAALVALGAFLYLRAGFGKPVRFAHWFPVVFLAGIQSDYSQPVAVSVAFAAVMMTAAIYAAGGPENRAGRIGLFLVLASMLYYLVGGPFLLFGGLCVLVEFARPGRRALGLVYALWCVVLPGAAMLAFGWTLPEALAGAAPLLTGPVSATVAILLYACVPIAALLGVVHRATASGQGSRDAQPGKRMAVLQAILLAGCAAATIHGSHRGALKAALFVDYCGEHGHWGAALATAKEYELNSPLAAHDVDRALFHEGRLLDDMFAYPQSAGVSALLLGDHLHLVGRAYMKRSDVFLDLGHVNVAEHMAFEALENIGELPAVLERLALVHVLKGQPEAARIFLRQLGRNPFFGNRAQAYLEALQKDPLLAGDPRVSQWRSVMIHDLYTAQSNLLLVPTEGRVLPGDDGTEPGQMLSVLLKANPENKMAFEYLIAHYLLNLQLDRVVERIGQFKALGYPELPRHVQEALFVYEKFSGGRMPDLHGYILSTEVRGRFAAFTHMVSRGAEDMEAVLKEDFGDTYYHYFGKHLGRLQAQDKPPTRTFQTGAPQ